MHQRVAPFLLACLAGVGAVPSPSHAQVATFTAGGGGDVALAPVAVRPGARAYVGSTHVNAHQDVAPGVADSLAPPAASVRSAPLAYGASPDLAGLLVRTNVGPTVVAFDPWRPIDGRGHRSDLEAARADFLERYGFVGGVRTHTNAAAETLRERDAMPPEPRGVLRVRPAPTKGDNATTDDLVRADG